MIRKQIFLYYKIFEKKSKYNMTQLIMENKQFKKYYKKQKINDEKFIN